MKNYFTSDFHFCHENVIKYDKRPFKNADEMNEYIINTHNNTVGKNDDVYFLGDFCFDRFRTEEFLKIMNGNFHFIKGNHDKQDTIKLYQKYGVYLGEQKMIGIFDNSANKYGKQEIVLNHYSMNVWDKCHHGTWHLFGHSHGSLPDNPNSLSIDVGCMLHNYIPLEYNDIKQIMKQKSYKPIDHHKK